MTDAEFDVVLCLSVEVSQEPINLDGLRRAEWRSDLRRVASRELLVQQWDPERLPTDEEARAVLDRALGNHPMANVGARPKGGEVDRSDPPEVLAVVVAEVLVEQDLAPIPDSRPYPKSVEGPLAEPRLVHVRPWQSEQGSDEERLTAEQLLQELVAEVPPALSIPVD